jgi:hypothetical protein
MHPHIALVKPHNDERPRYRSRQDRPKPLTGGNAKPQRLAALGGRGLA